MSTDGEANTGSTSQIGGSDYHGRSIRGSSHSSSSHHQSTRSRKGVAPRPMIDNQHKSKVSVQSTSSTRRKRSDSSSKANMCYSSSPCIRDHHLWTEREVKEFYAILVSRGSLQFKKISAILQPNEEGTGIRFKNKWNGERKRAINRGPMSDCRALIVSIINDYINLLSDTSTGPNLSQEERERLASWITDLIAALPLDTNSNTANKALEHMDEVYSKFFNYRSRLDMLQCLYTDCAPIQPFNHVVMGSTQSLPPQIITNSMQLQAPIPVPISPQLQMQTTLSSLGQITSAVDHNNTPHQILANPQPYFNVGLQNPMQQAIMSHASPVLVQSIWPINATEGVSVQNPCLVQPGAGVIFPKDLATLSNNDLAAQLRNILGLPQYSEIAQMPFNLNVPEGRDAIIKAIIDQNDRINAQLRQQLVTAPMAPQNIVYQPIYQPTPQLISVSTPTLSTVTYRGDVEASPQLTVCINNPHGNTDLGTVAMANTVPVNSTTQTQVVCESSPVRPTIVPHISSLSSDTTSSCQLDQKLADSTEIEIRLKSMDTVAASPAPSMDGSFSSKDTPVEISETTGKLRPFVASPLDSAGPSLI